MTMESLNPFDFDDWLEATANDPDDPALFLARRILQEHSLTAPLAFDEIHDVATARGIPVYPQPALDEDGLCYDHAEIPEPLIVLRTRDPFVLAHELYHALTRDNARRGILYRMTWFAETPVEQAANRFAEYLVGYRGRFREDWDDPGAE